MSGPSSGSRFSVRGVGTQTMIASTLASAAKRVEAVDALAHARELFRGHVLDVRLSRLDRVDLARVDVDGDDVDALLCEVDGQRESHVAKPDNANAHDQETSRRGKDAMTGIGRSRYQHKFAVTRFGGA